MIARIALKSVLTAGCMMLVAAELVRADQPRLLAHFCITPVDHDELALARAECDGLAEQAGDVEGVLRPAVCVPCRLCTVPPPACEAVCREGAKHYLCEGAGPS